MKKSLLATTFVAFPLSAKTTRLRNYGCIAIVLLAGCTATQVRWDATKMREDVMVYYNDQIMDNLIRAKYKLPFVHVDINLLTSTGGSQISGTIGAGETTSNNSMQQRTNQTVKTATDSAMPSHMLAGTIGIMGTLAHAAMRPFTYSVTPQQTETLTISAVPALGSQALVSPTQTESVTPTPTPEVTKTTITYDQNGNETSCIKEETLKPPPTPKPETIYALYEKYANCPREGGVLSESPIRPREGTYVPGTLKRWRTDYYYVLDGSKCTYYKFCKQLFTKGQAASLEKALLQNQAASAATIR
jgi:hypothetical protein